MVPLKIVSVILTHTVVVLVVAALAKATAALIVVVIVDLLLLLFCCMGPCKIATVTLTLTCKTDPLKTLTVTLKNIRDSSFSLISCRGGTHTDLAGQEETVTRKTL